MNDEQIINYFANAPISVLLEWQRLRRETEEFRRLTYIDLNKFLND